MHFDAGALEGDLRVRGRLSPTAFSLVSILEQDGVVSQGGHRVRAGDILAIAPGGLLDARFQGRTAYVVVSAPWSLVTPRAKAFAGWGEPRAWFEAALHSPPPEVGAACGRVLRGAASLLRALGGEIPASAAAFLCDELLDGVLTALAASSVEGETRRGALNAARIVREVEDFLDGGARPDVQVEDIRQALNVSRRTLYRAFQEVLDVSPKAYLRLRNLSAARARLLDGGGRSTTVTQVALDHGFWELGRFAGAYRAMFGEPPSETLRGSQRRNLER
jgi:AraC family ethanolamine operon transcriptional activator